MRKLVLFLWPIFAVAAPPAGGAQETDPARLFAHGAALIERHCGKCYKSEREEFEAGIAEVLEAVEAGYPDKASAYRILADAYRQMTYIHAQPDSEEQRRYRLKFIGMYENVLSLEPRDTATRYLYATSLRDRARELAELRRILEIDPQHALSHFSIGLRFINEGRHQDGVEHVQKAIDFGEPWVVEQLGENAVIALRSRGLTEQARSIAERIKRKVAE